MIETRAAPVAGRSTGADPSDPGFAVYVHWPFCLAKCPYCDFNSHVRAAPIDEDRFVAAMRAEITHRAAATPGRVVHSIFFGGGTPSLMRPQTVQRIIDAIGERWTIEADAEITLEANPTSVEAGRFRGYRAAGVNRLSIGVQALEDADLKALGRRHSVAEAVEAVRVAASIFPRYSFDLIYARPGQSESAWRAELAEALKMAGEHLSLYQLTIEPDTIYEQLWRAGKLKTPDEELARALFDATQEVAEAHGLPAYEVSNHARPGAESRHNLVYWRYGEYAGIGPGAHGRLVTPEGRLAQAAEKHPEMWLTQVESEGHGLVENTPLSAEEQGDEFLLMGLRLREGIDRARFEALSGRPISQRQIDDLAAEGFIEVDANGRIRVTPSGAPLLDSIVADLAA
ncbi:MAG: coproporphyrinogen III oxidase [Hyphomicrobiales bacterium]|nr:coproporphyrinogen III oxidase [Hyphomicrobiales bacterium]